MDVIINTRKSAGASVFLSSMIANLQAWECIRILTDVQDPQFVNKKGYLNISDFTIDWEEIPINPKCSFCSVGKEM